MFAPFQRLAALHSSLVLGGIGFPDQHRDWRLDIDDMTYEVGQWR